MVGQLKNKQYCYTILASHGSLSVKWCIREIWILNLVVNIYSMLLKDITFKIINVSLPPIINPFFF